MEDPQAKKPVQGVEADPMYSKARQIAQDKLVCLSCKNADWKQFLFIGTYAEPHTAGCKRCGAVYSYDPNLQLWNQIGVSVPGFTEEL